MSEGPGCHCYRRTAGLSSRVTGEQQGQPQFRKSDPNTPFRPGHRTLEPEITLRLRTAVWWETAAARGPAKLLHSRAAAAGQLRSHRFCGFFPDSANLAPGEKNARSI